jgi:hypothetical protein
VLLALKAHRPSGQTDSRIATPNRFSTKVEPAAGGTGFQFQRARALRRSAPTPQTCTEGSSQGPRASEVECGQRRATGKQTDKCARPVASRNAVRMATWSFFASGNPTRDARAATRTACCRATQDSKRYLPLSRGHGPLAAQLTGAEVMRVRKHCAQTLETTHHIKTPGRLSRSRTCMVLTASINLPSVDLQKKGSVRQKIDSQWFQVSCLCFCPSDMAEIKTQNIRNLSNFSFQRSNCKMVKLRALYI